MSGKNEQGPQNLAQAEASAEHEALEVLLDESWVVWGGKHASIPGAYARWCAAKVREAVNAANKRAEKAEATVAERYARIKVLEGERDSLRAYVAALKSPPPDALDAWERERDRLRGEFVDCHAGAQAGVNIGSWIACGKRLSAHLAKRPGGAA